MDYLRHVLQENIWQTFLHSFIDFVLSHQMSKLSVGGEE